MSVTSNFQVSGMSCGHCERAITDEINELDGVESISVSAKDGKLQVVASAEVTPAAIIAAVDEAGYSASAV